MISEQWKFLSLFLTFAMSAVQIFNVKKTARKVLQDFKTIWVFFNSLFFSRIRTEGRKCFHQEHYNLEFIRHKILKCFSSLKSLLSIAAELPHLHTAVWGCCPQLFKGHGQCWQLLMKMPRWPGKVPSCPYHLPRDKKPRTSWLIKAQLASNTQFPDTYLLSANLSLLV